jgi:hypothetical protein
MNLGLDMFLPTAAVAGAHSYGRIFIGTSEP